MAEKKLHVLIVDNNPLIVKLLEEALVKEGHGVETAPDGLTAIGKLKERVPDLVVTDLIMPNIGGEKLCRIIRSTPEYAHIFIIILSGIAAEEELNPGDYGADFCVAKGPFKRIGKHVLDVVHDLLAAPEQTQKRNKVGYEEVYQREVTKELLCARKHFEVILSNMSEGILEFTSKGDIIYANSSFFRMVGMSEEKLLASNFVDLFKGKEERERCQGLLEGRLVSPLESENNETLELNGRRVALNFFPIKDEEQETNIAIVTDVTERHAAQQALVMSETRFKELFSHMSSGVVVLEAVADGRDFSFVDLNFAAEQLDGVKKEDVYGKSVRDFFPDGRDGGLCGVMQRVWKTGSPESHSVSRYEDRRVAFWRENFIYKLPSGEIVLVFDDITERKQVEEERERLIRELQEALVQVKTLSGFLPICASCKKIRDDQGYWSQVEEYIRQHSDAEFSHGICPDCAAKLYPDFVLNKNGSGGGKE